MVAGAAGTPDDRQESVAAELQPQLEIVRPLGGGSLSTVYLAREPELRRLVAVKVLRPRATRRVEAMVRFDREARALARVSHPNVVSIFRVGRLSTGAPYLVMQYVRGPSLAQRLLSPPPLTNAQGCATLASIAAALAAVHAHDIVHRDVRPESVLCGDDGRTLLADFGLAAFLASAEGPEERVTTAGHIITDLEYTAPEFFRGEDPTTGSDLYALASLAYHLFTGAGPHDRGTLTARIHAQRSDAPDRLADRGVRLPADVQDVLDACLAPAPADRPAASEVSERLWAATRELEGETSPEDVLVTGSSAPIVAPAVPLLRVLGALTLEDASGQSDPALLGQPKRVALLAYLALGPEGRFKRRDSLIGVFWPDAEQESARHSLRQALYVLRRGVGGAAIRTRGDGEVGIDPDVLTCDAARFESLIESGNPRDAIAFYGGDLLPGFYLDDAPEFERWLEVERLRLRRMAARALWDLSDRAAGQGDVRGAAGLARRAADLDPFDEAAVHRLIERLAEMGDRAGAIAAYDHFARRLVLEYEIEPSPETQALIARVRGPDG